MAEMAAQVAALVVDPGSSSRTQGGSSPQVGALRGGAGLSRATRASRIVSMTTTASGWESSTGARTARPRLPDRSSRPSRSSASRSRRALGRPWSLENARPSKFTARSVYAEQWLFHGPLFQAIAHMGKLSDKGIEGRLRVLPLEPLVKSRAAGDVPHRPGRYR